MKTILVVYADNPVTKTEARRLKQYAFNTNEKVKVGDRFQVDGYDTPVQVSQVLEGAPYKFVNISTGDLSYRAKGSTRLFPLREIRLRQEDSDEVVYATREES